MTVVNHIYGPAAVLSGAGSGKTSVALHRLSFLLHNDQNSRSEKRFCERRI